MDQTIPFGKRHTVIVAALIASSLFANEPEPCDRADLFRMFNCDTVIIVDTVFEAKGELVTDTTYFGVCPLQDGWDLTIKQLETVKRILKARRRVKKKR